MKDEFRDDHEFENIEKDQLDEFEKELSAASKKKRNRIYLIAGGTVVCAAALLYFSGMLEQMEPAKPAVPVKASAPKAPPAKAPEEKPQAAKADPEMESTQKNNIVEEDSKAPGALVETANASKDKGSTANLAGEKDPAKAGKSKPSAEPKAEQPSTKPYAGFVLQVAATSDTNMAISARDDLAAKGHKSWISIGKANENVFAVEVGEFASGKDAAPQKDKLEKAGFEPRLAPSGAKAILVAGVFQDKPAADALAARAKTAGFAPKVVSRKDSSDLYLVRMGPYASAEEAKKAGDAVKAAGYSPVSVSQ